MLYKYFTEKLLGLQDVDIEKIEEIDNSIHINWVKTKTSQMSLLWQFN